jgi:hypothetical protein
MTQLTRANAFPFLLLRWLRGQLTEAQLTLFVITGWITAPQAEEIRNTDRENPADRIAEIEKQLQENTK